MKSIVAKDQLLVFDVKDGWEPLCKFLDLPIPDIPFPNINDRGQVKVLHNTICCVAWITLLGVPLFLSYAISLYTTDWGSILVTLALAVGLVYGAGQFVQSVVRKHSAQKTMKT